MLIAHGLPVELSVSTRAGARILPIAAVRVLGALTYAYLLNGFCLLFAVWQTPAPQLFQIPKGQGGIVEWSLSLLQNQGLIILIIFCIIVFMRVLKRIGLLDLIERLLAPVLPLFGMGRQAAPLTVVGMVMGLSYGGALIIRETARKKMDEREVFNSMALMGMCHGLVEDSLIMAAIGGKLAGILWGRILFSLIVVFLLVTLSGWLGNRRCNDSVG
jgi:spore maturation protein SpmB